MALVKVSQKVYAGSKGGRLILECGHWVWFSQIKPPPEHHECAACDYDKPGFEILRDKLEKEGLEILSSTQNWNISTGKAIALFRDLIHGRAVKIPDGDMASVYDPKEWDQVIVDTVPAEWKEAAEYGITGLHPGDKILVLRKITF